MVVPTTTTTSSSSSMQQPHHRKQQQQQPLVPKETCRANGTVNAGSSSSTHWKAFMDTAVFQPTCTACRDDSNLNDLLRILTESDEPRNADTVWAALQNLRVDVAWSCANECATCFPSTTGDCGTVTVDFVSDFKSVPGVALDALVALGPEAGVSAILAGTTTVEVCIDYTTGVHVGHRVCAMDTVDERDIHKNSATAVERPCTITYDGVECTWCLVTVEGCWMASCSNVVGGTTPIDTCQLTGVDAEFQLLPYMSGVQNSSELTVGACGGGGGANATEPPNNATEPPIATSTFDFFGILGAIGTFIAAIMSVAAILFNIFV